MHDAQAAGRLYTAHATAFNGREGRVTTDDAALDLVLVRPKEMGGPGGQGTNPEQLFACGYSACFGATLQALSRARKLPLAQNEVVAHIGLVRRDEGRFVLSADLEVTLAGLSQEDAESLVQAAHETCPYSISIKATVDVGISLKVVEA
ncbi:organic hydroperoxide resistance protein [Pseudaminobacter sp. 19-2017]|uniref:Organic hydroperoxide resistance protein n=1 Tax=Pseudaminobacter soli (ex Zhang et al. 2022) TaxID=2831468 RepID=A0A942DZN9_9HYPH|nr:organic hydroperoxide resistance protein [Pseudaminobacter soli]